MRLLSALSETVFRDKSCFARSRLKYFSNRSFSCKYQNSIITLPRVISTLTPLSPFQSLLSTKSEMNSGERGFKLMKYSNEEFKDF
ncbi:hypothetical protein GLYMA_01G046100v4 [Glycine max]|uniref:Uncharacterized protein n=1 Tax=Glycine max TaxID=3847 RepID=A0A0R0LDA7_SOYBN|nr:hypothetical protein JHK87_000451 [Glycine soja]KAH1161605.1 hypothetical protein GYH30_000481 [Glycine max]KRH74843.1 hypothetical protein GLYMA_01G046100v4 [Glycine max]